jgi:YggT family protein
MLAATSPVLRLLCIATSIYLIILFAKVILSWVVVLGGRPPSSGPARTAVDLVDDVTEPVLRPLRGVIPPARLGAVGLDLSLIVLFIILFVIRAALHC